MLLLIGFWCRGWIYRKLVTYHPIGQRTNYDITNPKLATYIQENTPKKTEPDVRQIIRLALAMTNKRLNFTAGKNNVDPNQLIHSRTAHCVGYAAFFATVCNALLAKYHLDGQWKALPQAGQLYVLGTNITNILPRLFSKTTILRPLKIKQPEKH